MRGWSPPVRLWNMNRKTQVMQHHAAPESRRCTEAPSSHLLLRMLIDNDAQSLPATSSGQPRLEAAGGRRSLSDHPQHIVTFSTWKKFHIMATTGQPTLAESSTAIVATRPGQVSRHCTFSPRDQRLSPKTMESSQSWQSGHLCQPHYWQVYRGAPICIIGQRF